MPVPDAVNASGKKAARVVDAEEAAAREAQAAYDAKAAKRARPAPREAPEFRKSTTAAEQRLVAEVADKRKAERLAARIKRDTGGSFDLSASEETVPPPVKPVIRNRREAPPAAEPAPIPQRRENPRLRPENAAARQATEARIAQPEAAPAPAPMPIEAPAMIVMPPPPAQKEPSAFQRIVDSKWSKPIVALGALVTGWFGVQRGLHENPPAPSAPESTMAVSVETPSAPSVEASVQGPADNSNVEISKPSEATPAPEAAPVAKAAVELTTPHRVRAHREPTGGVSSAADDLRLRLDTFASDRAYKADLANLNVSGNLDDLVMPTPDKSAPRVTKHTESHAKKAAAKTASETTVPTQADSLKGRLETYAAGNKITRDLSKAADAAEASARAAESKAKLETYAAGNEITKDMSKLADTAEISSKAEKSKAGLETWIAGQRMISKMKNFDGVNPDTFKLQKKDAMRLAEGDPKDLLEAMSIWAKFPGEKAYNKLKAEERLALLEQQLLNVRLVNSLIKGTNRNAIESQLKVTETKLRKLAEEERGFITESDEEEIHLDDEIES